MAIVNHWSILVNTDIPITGVLNVHEASWIHEDMVYNSIDIDFEEHCKECIEDYHDECYFNDTPTLLIGYIKDEKTGLYDIDVNAEYSAIITDNVIQVTHSKWISKAALCSPCYPGQADLSTEGEFKAYNLPPSMFDDETDEHLQIVENKGP